MASVSDDDLEDFKELCKKKGVVYKTEAEYRESAQNLYDLAELLLDIYRDEKSREMKLQEYPKGFAFAGEGRTCPLCKHGISGEMWYDKWGMKCMDCQHALNKKTIPGYVFKDSKNEKHITASQLSWRFNIKSQRIKKMVREGKLKARIVPSTTHGDTLVFLRKENPDLATVLQR